MGEYDKDYWESEASKHRLEIFDLERKVLYWQRTSGVLYFIVGIFIVGLLSNLREIYPETFIYIATAFMVAYIAGVVGIIFIGLMS